MSAGKSIDMLVRALRDKGVVLTLDEGRVRYRGPPQCSSAAELRELKGRRDETIEYLRRAEPTGEAHPPNPHPSPLPLSCSQRWWWELEAITGPMRQPAFFIQVLAALDRQVLRRALTELTRRHEALRTRFVCHGATVTPVIDPPVPVETPLVDFSSQPAAHKATAAGKFIHDFRLATYQLNGGSLFRTCLVKLSSEHFVVLIGAHHINVDGWSSEILMRDLAAAYAAFAAGEPLDMPEPRMRLSDFTLWEQQWLQSAAGSDPYEFWSNRLEHASCVELPTDYARTAQTYGFPEQRRPLSIPEQTVGALHDLSRRSGTTLQVVLLAVYTLLLSRWSGRTEILLGNYMAFRSAPDATELVGCLGGNRPIHVTVVPGSPFGAHLERVWHAYLLAQDFQKPVSTRVAWERRLNRVIANFHKTDAPPAAAPLPPPPGWGPLPVNHELALVLYETPTALHGSASYAASLFLARTIEQFCSDFERLLHQVAVQPDGRLVELVPQISYPRS